MDIAEVPELSFLGIVFSIAEHPQFFVCPSAHMQPAIRSSIPVDHHITVWRSQTLNCYYTFTIICTTTPKDRKKWVPADRVVHLTFVLLFTISSKSWVYPAFLTQKLVINHEFWGIRVSHFQTNPDIIPQAFLYNRIPYYSVFPVILIIKPTNQTDTFGLSYNDLIIQPPSISTRNKMTMSILSPFSLEM